jgi:3-oxoacyl-[acyl-carrier-protein] synthase-3
MAFIRFHNAGISAVSSCVPKKIYHNSELGYLIPQDKVEKTIKSIGIVERRIADEDVCASDLCCKAAEQLLGDNGLSKDGIDVLLFMSQTSDYRIPATSPIIQHRLGLSKDTCCIDLTLGCSGYVFALSTAFAYASMEGVNRVLLLDGETFSKIVNRRDRVDWPLYGDGGTATLVEKGDFGESCFLLKSDGSGQDAVRILGGGMRNGISPQSLVEKKDVDGCIRNDLEVFMDGMAVFDFAMGNVPRSIRDLAEAANFSLDSIDWLVFHQANKFMTDFFVRDLKISPEKVPYCIQKYGNTSSASIPLTISSELPGKIKRGDRMVISGFGAGLSWGAASMTMGNCAVSPVIEY